MSTRRPEASTVAADGPALRVGGLCVRYHGAEVLRGVDLELGQGEWLAVIGPNGAGKSTLLRALAGVVPSTGQIAGAGGGAPASREVSLVPQSPVLPEGMTAAEYVLMGRTAHLGWLSRESRADRRITGQVLTRLRLQPLASRPVTALSGGEAQRVVLARAMAQQAPLMLLDEPTSALDLGHQVDVLELVDELRRADGLSVVAAMHDLSTAARFADRLLLIDRGRVVAVGTPAEVLDPALLSRVYGTELTVRVIDGERVVLPASRPQTRPQGQASSV
ncbi:MAG: ABC transporter ATP-binding protein [Ornithinimicrobium sp.]